ETLKRVLEVRAGKWHAVAELDSLTQRERVTHAVVLDLREAGCDKRHEFAVLVGVEREQRLVHGVLAAGGGAVPPLLGIESGDRRAHGELQDGVLVEMTPGSRDPTARAKHGAYSDRS